MSNTNTSRNLIIVLISSCSCLGVLQSFCMPLSILTHNQCSFNEHIISSANNIKMTHNNLDVTNLLLAIENYKLQIYL